MACNNLECKTILQTKLFNSSVALESEFVTTCISYITIDNTNILLILSDCQCKKNCWFCCTTAECYSPWGPGVLEAHDNLHYQYFSCQSFMLAIA